MKGLLREAFAKYFEYIVLQLSHPEVQPKADDDWTEHLGRLERHHTKGNDKGLHYKILFQVMNAADYGVPQKRQRVIIVGFRADLQAEWAFPRPTHTLDALLRDQWVGGAYWDRHEVPKKDRPEIPKRLRSRVEKLRSEQTLFEPEEKPWQTVRDALRGLPDPQTQGRPMFHNHQHNAGARSYVGHTGSLFDEPAKTLKAGDHGVPGGENTLLKPDGSLRYFTVREAARLQTFDDDYVFHGAWTETMRQLGNAVPVLLSQTVAEGIRDNVPSR